MTRSQAGLAAFVGATLAALCALVYDLDLYMSGDVTITEWATAEPWRAVALVVLTLLGPAGLAAHFRYYRRSEGE